MSERRWAVMQSRYKADPAWPPRGAAGIAAAPGRARAPGLRGHCGQQLDRARFSRRKSGKPSEADPRAEAPRC